MICSFIELYIAADILKNKLRAIVYFLKKRKSFIYAAYKLLFVNYFKNFNILFISLLERVYQTK